MKSSGDIFKTPLENFTQTTNKPSLNDMDKKITCEKIMESLTKNKKDDYEFINCTSEYIKIVNDALHKCNGYGVNIPEITKRNICDYTINGKSLDNTCCIRKNTSSTKTAVIIISIISIVGALFIIFYIVHLRRSHNVY